MEWISVCGIFLAMVLMVVLAFRSVSILIIAPVCALVVILTNGMDLNSAVFTAPDSYLMGLGGFMAKYLLIFMLGAMLGKYMEDSGAARSIALYILKTMGTEKPYRVMLAIFVIGAVLTYGGINMFVVIFTMVPLARPLFKEMNLPWHLFVIPYVLGTGTITMSMLPGTPSVQNAVPAAALGTPLTSAPLVGLAASVATLVWGFIYMKRQLDKANARSEGYDGEYEEENDCTVQLPPLSLSVAPLLVLIITILIGSAFEIPNIIIPAGLLSIIVSAIVFRPYLENQVQTINDGALNAVTPAVFTAACVGVGILLVGAPGFKPVTNFLSNLPGNPLFSLASIGAILSMATGSATGALGIIMEAFSQTYLTAGVDPEALHRIAVIASSTLSCTPFAGSVFSILVITRLSHKEAYAHILKVSVIGHLIALAVALPLAIWLY
jgi:H+/gluconate symporter-like permease